MTTTFKGPARPFWAASTAAEDEPGPEVHASEATRGPIGPVGSGRVWFDLAEVFFIGLFLAVSLWLASWMREPMRQAERVARLRAECAIVAELGLPATWDNEENICR